MVKNEEGHEDESEIELDEEEGSGNYKAAHDHFDLSKSFVATDRI